MAGKQTRCPNCGADVHPKEIECPECGHALTRQNILLPVIAGAVGVTVALGAGAAVWVLLSPPSQAPVPMAAPEVQRPAPPAQAAAPPAPPPAAPLPPPETNPADAQLPLPQVAPGTAGPAADEASRKDFARTTQENFTQNGLDMKVSASGPQARVMTLAFSFPAKTAVELIASGPFPRQCKLRGFQSITFTDPSGASWSYDLSTDKLTSK